MAITFLLRAIFTIVSVALLVAAVVLLGNWYGGDRVQTADGVIHIHRDNWNLWTGIALLAWSFLGRIPILFMLARKDTDPMRPRRDNGQTVESPTGATLYTEQHGRADAKTVILTHGWSMDSTIWHYAKRDLGEHYRVLTWDLPGLGLSKQAKRGVSLPRYAEDLKGLIAQASNQPVMLVGHSIGGMIIETLTRDDPAFFARHVDRVVLLNTTYTNPLKTMILSGLLQTLRKPLIVPMMYLQIWLMPLVWLMQWQSYMSGSQHIAIRFGFGRFVTRSQLDHTALLMTRNSPAVVAHGDLAMLRWDGTQGLPHLTVPTLVVGGDADIVTKLSASEHIAAAVPSGRLHTVGGVNHMGPVEQAPVYHDLITAFDDGRAHVSA